MNLLLTGIVALLLLAACGSGTEPDPELTPQDTVALAPDTLGQPDTLVADEAPAPTDTVGAAPADDAFDGTVGNTDVERSLPGVATLQAVRSGRHDGFDRVVLEFDGEIVPGYHIEYIDRPVRACGSGDVVDLPGDGWLEIRMPGVRAHTEAGEATIQQRQRRPNLPIVKGLALTCDFEAVVTWVLGVSSPNRYRVVELAEPPRLAVDIRH